VVGGTAVDEEVVAVEGGAGSGEAVAPSASTGAAAVAAVVVGAGIGATEVDPPLHDAANTATKRTLRIEVMVGPQVLAAWRVYRSLPLHGGVWEPMITAVSAPSRWTSTANQRAR
jgi:hypothetical protein